jgi:hypothetical protein
MKNHFSAKEASWDKQMRMLRSEEQMKVSCRLPKPGLYAPNYGTYSFKDRILWTNHPKKIIKRNREKSGVAFDAPAPTLPEPLPGPTKSSLSTPVAGRAPVAPSHASWPRARRKLQ